MCGFFSLQQWHQLTTCSWSKSLLAKNNVTTPYFSDLAPADFYLPWLKSAPKGQRFCDASFRMRKKNGKNVQKLSSKNAFYRSFQDSFTIFDQSLL